MPLHATYRNLESAVMCAWLSTVGLCIDMGADAMRVGWVTCYGNGNTVFAPKKSLDFLFRSRYHFLVT